MSSTAIAETPSLSTLRLWTDEDLYYLSSTMYGEARGEGEAGMLAVGSVVLNRVKHPKFPKTIKAVCLQKGQFTVWSKNNPNYKHVTKPAPERVLALAKKLLDEGSKNHFLYFESHALGRRGVLIGKHVFR